MNVLSVVIAKKSYETVVNYESMSDLIEDAANHEAVREITIMNYYEEEIEDRFDLFPNVREITVTNTNIRTIPSTVEKLKNLEVLTLVNNQINLLSTTFGEGLPKLRWLDLQMNKIHYLPDSMACIGKLVFLNVNKNSFRNFPEVIAKIPKLETLMLNDNKIKVIPSSIKGAKSLQYLNIVSNRICRIPAEIGELVALKELDLTDNVLKTLPLTIGNLGNLKVLKLTNNYYLEAVPVEIGRCGQLTSLYVENNDLHSLPVELVDCRRLSKVVHWGNPIQLSPVLERFLEQGRNYEQAAGFYGDRQNVHNSSIQQSIKVSLMNLLNDPVNHEKDAVIRSVVEDDRIDSKNKQLLVGYINDDKDVHATIYCTFYDAFSKVYGRMRTAAADLQTELYKRLNEELAEGECMCFTGRLSRMVNVLNGFYDDIQVSISSNEQIANVILAIRTKYGLKTDDEMTDDVKEKITGELKDRGYEDDIIGVWLMV